MLSKVCDTKLLLIEDIPVMRKALLFVLQSIGCNVDCHGTGEYAVEYFNSYDFIFLDIGLPGISGIEVCKAIRAKETNSHIPIVALTAHHEDEEVIAECNAAGFDGFVGKPLDETKAITVLRNYLTDFPCYVDGPLAGELQ